MYNQILNNVIFPMEKDEIKTIIYASYGDDFAYIYDLFNNSGELNDYVEILEKNGLISAKIKRL